MLFELFWSIMRETKRIERRLYDRILAYANIRLESADWERRQYILELTEAIYTRKASSPKHSDPALTGRIKHVESRALLREVAEELQRELLDEYYERFP